MLYKHAKKSQYCPKEPERMSPHIGIVTSMNTRTQVQGGEVICSRIHLKNSCNQMRQFGPDQKSAWFSEAGRDQEHFFRKSLWMGQHTATPPLLFLLALWARSLQSFLAQNPIYPLVIHINLSFWLSPSSFPSLLSPSPEAQRGRMVQSIQSWNARCSFSLCSFIPHIPPGQCSY